MAKELELSELDLGAIIRPGDSVMWGQADAEPLPLTGALMAQRHAIGNCKVFLGVTYSDTLKAEYADCIRFSAYCGSGGNRVLVKADKLDILPCHYSQLRQMIVSGRLKVDVLLLQLAPANESGEYSLSIAHEYLIPALEAARVVIAEVNELAPWTHGERPLLDADLDYVVHTARSPLGLVHPQPGAAEQAIARHVAGLIDDGATLQFGLGALPETIIALPSTAGRHSRIVAKLSGPVSTPRSDAGIIVTEYGVADLRGAGLAERARNLIAIAHPDHRERLQRESSGD